jgi:hypothetical protein
MVSSEPPPFTFVVGCGRSGTSVLRSVLDEHSQLAIAHEGRFVFPLSRRRATYERPGRFDAERFAGDLLGDPGVRENLMLDRSDVTEALGGTAISDYPDAVRRIFACYAAKRGKTRYGDKMPAYVLHMPELADMFLESRFVHIIRDGRDVALSALAIDGKTNDLVTVAIDWRRRVEAGRAAGRRLGPDRYHEVRYEQLLSDPEPQIALVCQFLDLDYEPAMLQFFARGDGTPRKVRANPRHARLAEPLSPGSRAWGSDMSTADVERFEAVAGGLLSELAYARAFPRPSVSARLAGLWGDARWQVRRARRRAPGFARRLTRSVRPD